METKVSKQELIDTLSDVMVAGRELLKKDKFESLDLAKLKVMKSMDTAINASIAMLWYSKRQHSNVLI